MIPTTTEASRVPACPKELIEAEFGAGTCAWPLIELAMRPGGYDNGVAGTLHAAATGRSGESWPERRLAVLLLEHHLLRLSPEEAPSVELAFFIGEAALPELLRKLGRLRRAHEAIREPDDFGGWWYFLRVARDISKLALARYLFSPQEVACEVRRHLAISRGVASAAPPANAAVHRPLDAPEYEAAVLQELCAGRDIFWVSGRCGSEVNALVEFPLTSAVVVVKPPGSDYEIELKRAGTRRQRLLDVITQRDGVEAPVSHRLLGGSLGWLGEREASSTALFARIYRLVHGRECPCSQTVMNSSIVSVPTTDGERHILDYLAAGGHEMSEAMDSCIESFPRDTGVAPASYDGPAGRVLQFIGQALPQQAVIFGSTSFRLDRIAAYLSGGGAEHYFGEGLGRAYTMADARWLADSVLEEILGEVEIPAGPYRDYGHYVDNAFAVPGNRRRADRNYESVMRQIGECWGTLMAVRGFSDGESFVQRNVGLKSMWRDGAWRTRIIFMDHDDLTMAGSRYRYLWPSRELAGMQRDQIHILGGSFGDDAIPGEAGALRDIYRVDAGTAAAGAAALQEETCAAYRKTQAELDSNRELQALFYRQFIDRHRDFDRLMGSFLSIDPSRQEVWKSEAEAYLRDRGYDGELISETVDSILRFRAFVERMRFLYGGSEERKTIPPRSVEEPS